MRLSHEARAQMKRDYPAHFFLRVVTPTHTAIVAIPKEHAEKDVPGMPGMTVELLHGATMRVSNGAA